MIEFNAVVKKLDDVLRQCDANQVYVKGQRDLAAQIKAEIEKLAPKEREGNES